MIQKITAALESGRLIQIEISKGEAALAPDVIDFAGFSETIEELARSVAGILDKIKPDSAAVEFGIEAGIESGKLTAVLLKGTAGANLKVTLGWGKP